MNEILSSRFTHDNKIITEIKNPSDRVKVLMANISSRVVQTNEETNSWMFTHYDIGKAEEMEILFKSLDMCK